MSVCVRARVADGEGETEEHAQGALVFFVNLCTPIGRCGRACVACSCEF